MKCQEDANEVTNLGYEADESLDTQGEPSEREEAHVVATAPFRGLVPGCCILCGKPFWCFAPYRLLLPFAGLGIGLLDRLEVGILDLS